MGGVKDRQVDNLKARGGDLGIGKGMRAAYNDAPSGRFSAGTKISLKKSV